MSLNYEENLKRVFRDLAKALGNVRFKVYQLGDMLILAPTGVDLSEKLYAITLPDELDIKLYREFRARKPVISVSEDNRNIYINILDIVDSERAKLIANALATKLEKFMPFTIKRIDNVTSITASEDGGLITRYSIRIVIHKSARRIVDNILSIVKNMLERVYGG